MDIEKMRTASHLLPAPGGEVVRECLDEIEHLRALVASTGAGLREMTIDRNMARKSLDELQQTWADNAPAAQYKKELDTAIAEMAKATEECGNYCPFCGVDPRPQKQCGSCENDHLSSACMRNGKHKDDCAGMKAMKKVKDL